MDLNLVVLAGTLAAPPERRSFESGSRLLRFLVTVRSEEPRKRVDVVPVTWWDPPESADLGGIETGHRLWVAGAVQRRFWSAPEGRRSRLEVVAHQVQTTQPDTVATTVISPGPQHPRGAPTNGKRAEEATTT